MNAFESYEIIHPLQVVQGDKTYSCEEIQWYNLKEGERYLLVSEDTYRIGTFDRFKWIEMYQQWMVVFTYVRSYPNEYCQECAISGALPYVYYKIGQAPKLPASPGRIRLQPIISGLKGGAEP